MSVQEPSGNKQPELEQGLNLSDRRMLQLIKKFMQIQMNEKHDPPIPNETKKQVFIQFLTKLSEQQSTRVAKLVLLDLDQYLNNPEEFESMLERFSLLNLHESPGGMVEETTSPSLNPTMSTTPLLSTFLNAEYYINILENDPATYWSMIKRKGFMENLFDRTIDLVNESKTRIKAADMEDWPRLLDEVKLAMGYYYLMKCLKQRNSPIPALSEQELEERTMKEEIEDTISINKLSEIFDECRDLNDAFLKHLEWEREGSIAIGLFGNLDRITPSPQDKMADAHYLLYVHKYLTTLLTELPTPNPNLNPNNQEEFKRLLEHYPLLNLRKPPGLW